MNSISRKQRRLLGISLKLHERIIQETKYWIIGAFNRKGDISRSIINQIKNGKKIILTNHAQYRISERLDLCGIDMEIVKDDLRKSIYAIEKTKKNCYIAYGKLAKYIVNKDKIVITILPNYFSLPA